MMNLERAKFKKRPKLIVILEKLKINELEINTTSTISMPFWEEEVAEEVVKGFSKNPNFLTRASSRNWIAHFGYYYFLRNHERHLTGKNFYQSVDSSFGLLTEFWKGK